MRLKNIIRSIGKFVLNRIFLLTVLFMALFLYLGRALYQIQILDADLYKEKIYKNTEDTATIQGVRGNIYDRYGRPLAVNEKAQSLYFQLDTSSDGLNEAYWHLMEILENNGDSLSLDVEFPILYDNDNGFRFTDSYLDPNRKTALGNFLAEVYNTSRKDLTEEQWNASAEEVYWYMRDTTYTVRSFLYNGGGPSDFGVPPRDFRRKMGWKDVSSHRIEHKSGDRSLNPRDAR